MAESQPNNWSYENCTTLHDTALEFENQTIETLLESDLWLSLCPFLNISPQGLDSGTAGSSPTITNAAPQPPALSCHSHASDQKPHSNACSTRLHALSNRGYFTFRPELQQPIPVVKDGTEYPADPSSCPNIVLTEALAMGVQRLVSHGYPASAILMYDETWLVGQSLSNELVPITGNQSLGDWFIFSVDPSVVNSYSPGPPHRDRWPLIDASSFRPIDDPAVPVVGTIMSVDDGPPPKYCTCWLALTDATVHNSCLYFIPRENDEGYHVVGSGDQIAKEAIDLRNVVAQPLDAGSSVVFSHRVIHWGSNPQPGPPLGPPTRPRIALSLAFADHSFEEAYFDHDQYLTPFPPMGLRLGLFAGQQVQYEHLERMDKHRIGLYRRIFHSQKHYFRSVYADKISSSCQRIAFKLSQRRKPGGGSA